MRSHFYLISLTIARYISQIRAIELLLCYHSIRASVSKKMATITLQIPDELALRLDTLKDDLPQILMLGLREVEANPSNGFSGLTQILEFIASLPSPQEILALRLSDAVQTEIDTLLEKNRTEGLTPIEQRLWQQYEFVEHLVRIAKAQALLKLSEAA
ncbi:hypothetical protein [Microcoleus sp. CAWBG50]|uniref:hypothetical protein n=1 Tax=Microcoleus sp. CAWBG50 TaxID=2841646 RepID=UPI0025CF3303|nr:hypothetical protein [Microcoleus sp. CAWBG50]